MEEMMHDLKSELAKRVSGKKVTLVGMGNLDKGDDGFGIHLVGRLKERLKNASIFECGTTPENYLGPIVKSSPEALIIVDAANLGAEPGHTHIIEEEDILSLGLSTHDTSLKLFIAYLKDSLKGLDIFLVGVQPRNTEYGSGLSEGLKSNLAAIEEIFTEVLS